MYHFFITKEQMTGETVRITGADYNHAANVLRLKAGERLILSDEEGQDYRAEVLEICTEAEEPHVLLSLLETLEENHELPAKIWLFQGLPKSDKMEWIVQKATELGVSDIVPVSTKNCVVKLDAKKGAQKTERWQKIAESAAKQSKRSIIPKVHEPVSFTEAIRMCGDFEVKLIPYETENGMMSMCEAIVNFLPDRNIAVFIGPEGGFDKLEVAHAKHNGVIPVSLGKRILRTETAALAVLSMIMIRLEIAAEIGFEVEE